MTTLFEAGKRWVPHFSPLLCEVGLLTFVTRGTVAILNSPSYLLRAPPAQMPAPSPDPSSPAALRRQKQRLRPRELVPASPVSHSLGSNHPPLLLVPPNLSARFLSLRPPNRMASPYLLGTRRSRNRQVWR